MIAMIAMIAQSSIRYCQARLRDHGDHAIMSGT
jgi:hypothetical protein